MATITSSAINKSGKTVAPRAVSRRKPAEKPSSLIPTQTETPRATQALQRDQSHDVPASTGHNGEDITSVTETAARGEIEITSADSGNTIRRAAQEIERHKDPGSIYARGGREGRAAGSTGAQEQASTFAKNSTARQSGERGAPTKTAGVKRKRGTVSASEASPASNVIAPSSAAPSAAVGTGAATQPPRKRGRPRTVTAVLGVGGTVADAQTQARAQAQAPSKRGRPRKHQPAPQGEESTPAATSGATEGDGETRTVNDQSSAPAVRPKKRGRKPRQSTAPAVATTTASTNGNSGEADLAVDTEVEAIDESKTTMTELTRDKAVGKTSEREKLMQTIDWSEIARKRREESPPRPQVQAADEATPNTQTVQYRIVNGEIVVDEASTHIDRHAQAIANADMAVVDENDDLTKRVNRMTWMNDRKRDPAERITVYKMKSDPWSDEETDRFYEALRMFGTDFFIISKMFPPKTRRQIKLKFVREERLDPVRINTALSGGQIVPMDLAHYAVATGVEESEFKDPTAINEELRAELREQEADIKKKAGEMAEAQKQRDLLAEQRSKEKEERELERQAQKQSRDAARRRKRPGRGNVVNGDGSL